MSADIVPLFSRTATRKMLHGLATPADDPPCAANLFHIHSRSLLALPFVTRTTMWNDDPQDKGHIDFARGRRYAREAVAAIISDGAQSRDLEMVVDAILDRGFTRRGPGGRLCRQLSWAETGFLRELCKIAVGVSRLTMGR